MIKLTEQQIEKAESYVSLIQKEEFVEACMKQCLGSVEVSLASGDEHAAMPTMFMESTFMKSKYLMCAFIRLYLKEEAETEEGDEWLLSTGAYDEWAGSHVFNQLERMKDKKELRDKCFDLIKDYRDLERRLTTAIKGYMAVLNDPINRLYHRVYMETDESALENAKKQVEKLKEELETLAKEE